MKSKENDKGITEVELEQDVSSLSEEAQEVYEAAKISYQTEQKDGMNLATHGLPASEFQIEEILNGCNPKPD